MCIPFMQAPAREWVFAQQRRLTHLASYTANTSRLLRAAAAAESASAPRALLASAAASLDAVLTRVKGCNARLAAAVAGSVVLADGSLFVPPAAVPVLEENTQVGLCDTTLVLFFVFCGRCVAPICPVDCKDSESCQCRYLHAKLHWLESTSAWGTLEPA